MITDNGSRRRLTLAGLEDIKDIAIRHGAAAQDRL